MRVTILYNEPVLPPDHPDYASEAGVLESVDAVSAALTGRGDVVSRLGVTSARQTLGVLADIGDRADVVVNFAEGVGGASGAEAHVASLLTLAGVPFTGSPVEAIALTHDKGRTAWLLAGAGLRTAPSVRVARGIAVPEPELHRLLAAGPVIVKPACEDASLGVHADSVCADWSSLLERIEDRRERYGDVLVEGFVDGREFNLGVIALPTPRALPPAEIEFAGPGPRIVTYESKWAPDSAADRATPVRCPAAVSPQLATELERVALMAFAATGCRDYARVDVRVDDVGAVTVLEVNANPDIGPSAGLARALGVGGVAYAEFVTDLCDVAAARGAQVQPAFDVPAPGGARPSPSRAVRLRALDANDVAALVQMVRDCGLFRDDEVEVADEVLGETVAKPGSYQVLVAEVAGEPVGWSCHDRVPMTDATYDLYWIVVAPKHQGSGVGRQLLSAVEAKVAAAGGRWLLAETSSSAAYAATRGFYVRTGYAVVGDVADFYRAGDGRITFGKRLDGATRH